MLEALQQRGKVLVIDDDFLARRFVQRVLVRSGYQVLAVSSAAEAKIAIRENGCADLSCVVTDFPLPQMGGIDLLAWLAAEDPSLAAIVMSGSADKAIVEQTLRSGACNFLDKPLDRRVMETAVAEASELTRRKRRVFEIQKDVEQVGAVQRLLINSSVGGDSSGVALCLHPRQEAGGDFFSHFELPGDRSVAMLTDVSGHDLKSAFVSAYFQGMVRAMLESGMNLPAVFERGNLFLLNESAPGAEDVPISIAACSVVVDRKAHSIQVFNCGAPTPIFLTNEGECIRMRTGNSYPLGWFSEEQIGSKLIPLTAGQIIMWTDGVEEIADQLKAAPTAVAYALLRAQEAGTRAAWLGKAQDDILVAVLQIQNPDAPDWSPSVRRPILEEQYCPEQLTEVDALQEFWRNSLLVAAPTVNSEVLHDVLLCAREGIINALRHGCANGGMARLQLTAVPKANLLTLIIEDDGPGHDFDCEQHGLVATDQLTARHRGLILMRALSARFKSERRGAKIAMDFVSKEI